MMMSAVSGRCHGSWASGRWIRNTTSASRAAEPTWCRSDSRGLLSSRGLCEIQSEHRLAHARPSRDEGKLSGPQALDGGVDVTESGGSAVPLSLLNLVDPLEQIVHQRADGFASGNTTGRRPSRAAGARVRTMLRIPGGIPPHAGSGIHTGPGIGARMGLWGHVDVRHGCSIGAWFPGRYISTGIGRAAGSLPWQKAY